MHEYIHRCVYRGLDLTDEEIAEGYAHVPVELRPIDIAHCLQTDGVCLRPEDGEGYNQDDCWWRYFRKEREESEW